MPVLCEGDSEANMGYRYSRAFRHAHNIAGPWGGDIDKHVRSNLPALSNEHNINWNGKQLKEFRWYRCLNIKSYRFGTVLEILFISCGRRVYKCVATITNNKDVTCHHNTDCHFDAYTNYARNALSIGNEGQKCLLHWDCSTWGCTSSSILARRSNPLHY